MGVYDALRQRMDSAFVEYGLRYPFGGDEPIDYAPYTGERVRDQLFALPTPAWRAACPHLRILPVVLYHHGSQGMSDGNVWMAEFVAEPGFVFLAANFHWPLPVAV